MGSLARKTMGEVTARHNKLGAFDPQNRVLAVFVVGHPVEGLPQRVAVVDGLDVLLWHALKGLGH
jgi:hypothetical protein